MSIIAIANPVAGAGRGRRRWRRLLRYLRKFEHQVETWWTRRAGDGEPLALRALASAAERILAVGGDGTVHEIVNGLVKAFAQGPVNIPLGLIAIGRGNDYARSLRLPSSPPRMLDVALGNYAAAMDVGWIECRDEHGRPVRRCFNNVAGFGFDARVAARMTPRRGRSTGALSYLVNVLKELSSLRNYRIQGQIDGEPFQTTAFLFVIAVGRYFGGGLEIAPHARLDDGLFHLVWGRNFSRWDVIRVLPKVYRGRHLEAPGIFTRTARSLTLATDIPAPIEADGEVIGYTPVHIRIFPRILPVQIPPPGPSEA